MAATPVPYLFTDGISTLTAATTNANNAALYASVTHIDYTQIGPAGIFASQLIPTSTGSATFGGSQIYTFPSFVNATGFIASTWIQSQAGGSISTPGYCPPVYNPNGTQTLSNEKIIRGTATITVGTGVTSASVTVPLSGGVQLGASSLVATMQPASTISGWSNVMMLTAVVLSVTSLQFTVTNTGTSTGTGSVFVSYIAIGSY